MDRQEIFTRVKDHLLAQGARSYLAGCYEICAYRGTNQRKCAIGVLIDDACYNPDLEGQSPADDDVQAALACSGIVMDVADVKFLMYLQRLHDCEDPDKWPRLLSKFADDNGLVCTD